MGGGGQYWRDSNGRGQQWGSTTVGRIVVWEASSGGGQQRGRTAVWEDSNRREQWGGGRPGLYLTVLTGTGSLSACQLQSYSELYDSAAWRHRWRVSCRGYKVQKIINRLNSEISPYIPTLHDVGPDIPTFAGTQKWLWLLVIFRSCCYGY